MMDAQGKAILAALVFLEGHLRAPVFVQDLATIAGYSLFHFIRVFNQKVGLTPYNYLIRRRLSEAARELLAGDKKVIDLAMDYRFESHEGFTRAFSRMFDLTPSAWRKRGVWDSRKVLPSLGEDYLLAMGKAGFPKPEIKGLKPLRLAGWMIPAAEEGSNLSDRRKKALAALRAAHSEVDPNVWWELRIFPTEHGMPEMIFWGVPWLMNESIPAGFAEYHMEAATCFCFSENQVSDHPLALLTYVMQGFLPKSGYGLGAPMILKHHQKDLRLYIPVVKYK
ncbi:AraC family transcriptional regulator [bacterium]|nr:AraC family transcriptional regulator [bacterium]